MGIKSKIKHSISFLLHGEAKPIYANIHYLAPNEHLKDKKIVITGGGRGLGFAMAKKFVTALTVKRKKIMVQIKEVFLEVN